MLHSEELSLMLREITLKLPPTLKTPEANAMRTQLTKECEAIVARGMVVDIPSEIEVGELGVPVKVAASYPKSKRVEYDDKGRIARIVNED